MTVNNTDKFLVNRSNSSYQIEAQNLMTELQDTDLMLVNRGGVSYKATGEEIKESLGPKGLPNMPSIEAPANLAGMEVSAESDEIIKVSNDVGTPWAPTVDEVNAGDKKAVGGVYGKFIDINPSTADMGYGSRYPYQMFEGTNNTYMYWTGNQYPNNGNILSATLDLTQLGTINSVVLDAGTTAGGGYVAYNYQFLDINKSPLGSQTGCIPSQHGQTGSAPAPFICKLQTGARYLRFIASGGSNRRLTINSIAVNGEPLRITPTSITLKLAGNKDLSGNDSFELGDPVEQDSGHTPTTSAITNVNGNTLTLTDATDLENFRVGDVVQTGVSITAIDEAAPSITTDGGSWSNGDVVTGPATTPAHGTITSIDTAFSEMHVEPIHVLDTDRWIANQGKFVEGEPSLSSDAAPDVDGLKLISSAFKSTPAGSIGQTGASWQVAAYTDTNFLAPVAQELNSVTSLTQWEITPELAQETKYRCRVKHHAGTQDSEWSDPSTFKTAGDTIVVGKPSYWIRNESGDDFGTKKLINAFCGGSMICWGGVAADGTVGFAPMGTNLTTYITDPAGIGYSAAGLGYDRPYFLLRSDGVLFYKGTTGVPTAASQFTQLDTDVLLAGNFGAVQRSLGYVKSDGKIYVINGDTSGSVPGSCGYTSVPKDTPVEIPLVLPAGEKVSRFISCAGTSYQSHGWVVLTQSGKIFQFGRRENTIESGGTASSPINVTPVGERIVRLGMTAGAYNGFHGVYAISKTGKLYGYCKAGNKNNGPFGDVAWANPFALIDDSATYREVTSNYLEGTISKVMRHTEEFGLQWAKRDDSTWTSVPGSYNTNSLLYGAYSYNSGVAITGGTHLLSPQKE